MAEESDEHEPNKPGRIQIGPEVAGDLAGSADGSGH